MMNEWTALVPMHRVIVRYEESGGDSLWGRGYVRQVLSSDRASAPGLAIFVNALGNHASAGWKLSCPVPIIVAEMPDALITNLYSSCIVTLSSRKLLVTFRRDAFTFQQQR